MVRGIFQRAAVTIVLVASLLAPYGRCQAPLGAAGHDCCAHQNANAASAKANCCYVRSELPAVVVEHAALNPAPLAIAGELVPAFEPASTFGSSAAISVPQHSPPPGAVALRI